MKNILIAICLLFFTFSFAQGNKIEYPRIEKDAFGQSDLLILYRQLNEECALRDQLCIQVVNDKDKVIASQTLELNKIKEQADSKESQITTLQNEINEYKNNVSILQAQVVNKQSTISEKDLQIGILKSRFKWGGIGAGAVIAVLTFLLVK